jgi:hypothetical protein
VAGGRGEVRRRGHKAAHQGANASYDVNRSKGGTEVKGRPTTDTVRFLVRDALSISAGAGTIAKDE